tara:strand:+ start:194 stop:547 length:354 start_codon:yes stop_codon:yes gene_type:complete
MMKVLFVCNQNQHRSKTAEQLFRHEFETRSAGLHNNKPVTAQELSWADVVVVMADEQRATIAERFPQHYLHKKILSLDIPDSYHRDQPELVSLLKTKVSLLLSPAASCDTASVQGTD